MNPKKYPELNNRNNPPSLRSGFDRKKPDIQSLTGEILYPFHRLMPWSENKRNQFNYLEILEYIDSFVYSENEKKLNKTQLETLIITLDELKQHLAIEIKELEASKTWFKNNKFAIKEANIFLFEIDVRLKDLQILLETEPVKPTFSSSLKQVREGITQNSRLKSLAALMSLFLASPFLTYGVLEIQGDISSKIEEGEERKQEDLKEESEAHGRWMQAFKEKHGLGNPVNNVASENQHKPKEPKELPPKEKHGIIKTQENKTNTSHNHSH
jgi:hypothetical protein